MSDDPGNTPPPPPYSPYPPYPPPPGQPMPPMYGYVSGPYPPYGVPYGTQFNNGLGVAGMVCGIVGAIFGLVPFVFWLGFILGVLALVFGLIGRGRAKHGEASNEGQATTGVILGAVSIVLAIIGLLITISIVHHARHDFDCIDQTQTQQQFDDCVNGD